MIYTYTAVTRYLESWCKEHLGKHDSPAYQRYLDHFVIALAAKHDERRSEHTNHGKFGMSKAGGCIRAACYARAGVPGEDPDGSTRATWEIGHTLEVMALAVLRAAGFTVTGTQRRAELLLFDSAVDGVIEAGPVGLPYPVVLSVKTASYKASSRGRNGQWTRRGFCELPLDGVRQAQPSWYVQNQLEMEALGIGHTLVLVVAKDMVKAMESDPIMQESGSLTWYAELVEQDYGTAPYVQDVYEMASDGRPLAPPLYYKGPEYVVLPVPGDVASGWGGPNQAATGKFSPCFGCGYATRCAEDELTAKLERSIQEVRNVG